jgi:OmpA-OmpF porin, OOP family
MTIEKNKRFKINKPAERYSRLAIKLTWLCLGLAGLTGCAIPRDVPNLSTLPTGKSPALDRIADLQIRLDKLGAAPSAYSFPGKAGDTPELTQSKYAWAKAQCWVRNAYSEQHENDANGFSAAALGEAQKLTQGLEGKSAFYADTALINHIERVRPDLWQRAASLKQHPGYACSATTVACMEVQLSRSGHELADIGWRHANSYLAIAEDMAQRAAQLADACETPPPRPVIIPAPVETKPVAPPTPPPPSPAMTIEKITLNASALFGFDKRTQDDLLPQGKTELDQLAAKIVHVYSRVETIELSGYTDRLGSDAYNQALSLDRANTVQGYLRSKGVTAPMTAEGRGKANPVAYCDGERITPKLTECLKPNRRVEITIIGAKK